MEKIARCSQAGNYYRDERGRKKRLPYKAWRTSDFFCVDNLPPVLIPKFAELIEQSKGRIQKVALVIDMRGREFFYRFNGVSAGHQGKLHADL